MKFILFTAFLLHILLLSSTNCLYFHLYQEEPACFYDEFYTDVVVMVRYEILEKGYTLNDPNSTMVDIQMTSVDTKEMIYNHNSPKLKGKFSAHIEASMININIHNRWSL